MYKEAVLDRLRKYEVARIYPQGTSLRARSWLNNFEQNDRTVAAALLDRLTLFSDHAVNALLKAAFLELLNRVLPPTATPTQRRIHAESFVDESLWTHLEGERPKPVDSGYLMCRKLRDQINISDDRIMSPPEAVNQLQSCKNLIFVDDFSGTGSQAKETLNRSYNGKHNVIQGARRTGTNIFVLLIASTRDAIRTLADIPEIEVACTHVIETNAHISRQEPSPQLPPEVDRQHITEFLNKYALELNVPSYMEDLPQRTYGFGRLGLTIAFEHCIPDSTLPIYWAPGPSNWTPLKERK